jgi:hypothetical protein
VQIKKDDLTYQLRDSFLLRFADKTLSKQIGLLSKSELGINDPFRDQTYNHVRQASQLNFQMTMAA